MNQKVRRTALILSQKPDSCLQKRRPGHDNAEHSVSRTLTNNKGHRRIRKQFQNFTRTLSDPNGAVVNLSNKKFTKHEFDLLNKNLNFCPHPNQFNKSNFNKDLQAFFRRVKLKAHFRNNQPIRSPKRFYMDTQICESYS